MTPEQEILENAIDAFRGETNALVETRIVESTRDIKKPDAELWIQLAKGKKQKFLVEVKRNITEVTAIRLARDYAGVLKNHIFVTNYVHKKMAKTLKDLGVQFIDTAGNIYLNQPPTFIFIHGYPRTHNKVTVRLRFKEEMFGPAGLRVMFALICKRDLWNANYREIRIAADVALGTVANIMKELTQNGYIVERINKQKKLIRRKELFDKWTAAYIEKLRQKNILGRYKFTRPDFWQHADLTRLNALWGGETAAYMMTGYLKPEITTIYTDKPLNDLVLDLKLRRDNDGDVEIRKRFWNFDTGEDNKNIAPPMLIYADLIATGDARNIETARFIYDEYLEKHIGEN
jgi:hypothetical protein